jgi:selenium metabolism protein YedF
MEKVIVLNNEFFGHGSDELGQQLMGAFLKKLWGRDDKPDAIIFYNSAVKMMGKGSFQLDALNGLEESGVDLVACGTCIKYFKIEDQIMVGRISGMEEIVDMMMSAKSVINI